MMSRSTDMKQYKSLEKSNDYDHDKAEDYAEAVMELKTLNSRREYLQELLENHQDLQEYMWTTKEGVTAPLHKIEDDHLKNIMTYLIEGNKRIPAQIKAEARSRDIAVPDDGSTRIRQRYTLSTFINNNINPYDLEDWN